MARVKVTCEAAMALAMAELVRAVWAAPPVERTAAAQTLPPYLHPSLPQATHLAVVMAPSVWQPSEGSMAREQALQAPPPYRRPQSQTAQRSVSPPGLQVPRWLSSTETTKD